MMWVQSSVCVSECVQMCVHAWFSPSLLLFQVWDNTAHHGRSAGWGGLLTSWYLRNKTWDMRCWSHTVPCKGSPFGLTSTKPHFLWVLPLPQGWWPWNFCEDIQDLNYSGQRWQYNTTKSESLETHRLFLEFSIEYFQTTVEWKNTTASADYYPLFVF